MLFIVFKIIYKHKDNHDRNAYIIKATKDIEKVLLKSEKVKNNNTLF